jgi:ABC-type antimicrobial peptide transport system permease subunit
VRGVTKAGLVSHLPLAGESEQFGVAAESRLQADPKAWTSAHRLGVSAGYFEAMDIPVVEGRLFDARDRAGGVAVVVVSASYARVTFPQRSALGERIRIGGTEPAVWRTIVGVVPDVRHDGLDPPAGLQVYVPFDQWQSADNPMWVVASTPGDVAALVPALYRTIRAVHPDPTIDRVESMDAVLARALAQRTVVMRLFQAFGLLALCLAAIGGYGVMASSVAERRRELGIRAALGASAGSLRRAVIGETVALGVAGLAIGIPAAALLAFRFGSASGRLDPADGGVYVAAAGALLLAMLFAGWAPARRAARHDPAVALRAE